MRRARLRVRLDRRQHGRPDGGRHTHRARALGAAHRGADRGLRPDPVRPRPAEHRHRLQGALDQHDAQPRLPLLRHSRGGDGVRLPEIQLDDRRFQDLVSEARTRISRSCPEWTEHNVSDPGITLIELFAWMTEMTIYRLNRVPDNLHVALLDLLGIRLDGPSAATTSLRFKLADKPIEPILIEGGTTEVGTPRTANDESEIFQVDEDFTIPAVSPAAYVLQRRGRVRAGVGAEAQARPTGSDQLAFGPPPQVGYALHLGFEEPLD